MSDEKRINPVLAAALLAAQREISVAVKDSTNPHFKNAYASLGTVIEAVKPALNKQGIVFLQMPVAPPFENCLALETILLHESGATISGTCVIPLEKLNAQGIGSAITYARRYALASVLGLKVLDDDGEAAVDKEARTMCEPPQKAAIQAPVRFGPGPAAVAALNEPLGVPQVTNSVATAGEPPWGTKAVPAAIDVIDAATASASSMKAKADANAKKLVAKKPPFRIKKGV
jgi:hypothetical protein